jgi:hypothetical protein
MTEHLGLKVLIIATRVGHEYDMLTRLPYLTGQQP